MCVTEPPARRDALKARSTLREAAMFRRRRKVQSVEPNAEPSVWNGWTRRMIERVNGMHRLDFVLRSFEATYDFEADRYASAARLAAAELDDYEKMPLLFVDRPSGHARDRYDQIEATIAGKERKLAIDCELEILRASLSIIASEERAGRLILTSTDLLARPRDDAHESQTPVIAATFYDANGDLLNAIRQSFMAAQSREELPALRVILKNKIEATPDQFRTQGSQSYEINRIIMWEKWEREALPVPRRDYRGK
jgi:hypothetical protein